MLLLALQGGVPSCGEDTLVLHQGTVLRLAGPEEAATVLRTRDRFVTSLSRFDRQSRLDTAADVSEPIFLEFIGNQVLGWKDTDKVHLAKAVTDVQQRLRPFAIPFPKEILLIHTTGREEANAAYCRGAAIVLPTNMVRLPRKRLARLLIHELFHILSSQRPALRKELYGLIGFKMCDPITLPMAIKKRKITNPDGPLADCYLNIEVNSHIRSATPVLFASTEEYDPDQNLTFFRYVVFRLMLIEKKDDRWQPFLDCGEPVLLDPAKVPSFHRQIGRNTDYILHPDEVLAENFVKLVLGEPGLKSPEIVARMRALITGEGD